MKSVILKANKRIKLEQPETMSNWSQQHQNLKNLLFHFKSNSTLRLEKRIKNLIQ